MTYSERERGRWRERERERVGWRERERERESEREREREGEECENFMVGEEESVGGGSRLIYHPLRLLRASSETV